MKEPGREHLHRRHGEEVFRAGGLRSQLMPPLSHMTFSRSLLLDSAFLKKNPENVPHLPRGPVRKQVCYERRTCIGGPVVTYLTLDTTFSSEVGMAGELADPV